MSDIFILYLPNVANAHHSMEVSLELGTPLFKGLVI